MTLTGYVILDFRGHPIATRATAEEVGAYCAERVTTLVKAVIPYDEMSISVRPVWEPDKGQV